MFHYIILHDCPSCKIQGILEERFKGASLNPESKICSFCRFEEGIHEGLVRQSVDQIERELREWSERLGVSDVHQFCRTHFYGKSLKELSQAIIQDEPIEASFDVLEYLFPAFAGSGISLSNEQYQEEDVDETTEEAYYHKHPENVPIYARALATTMLADGKILPSEEKYIDEILKKYDKPPLEESDLKVWLPFDLPVPPNPEELVYLMLDLALIDDELDETEWRVVKEFARYWGCDRKKLEAEKDRRYTPKKNVFARIWTATQSLLFKETP